MGSADYSSFVARLDVHRDGVAAIFRKLVDHGDSEGSAEQGAADQSSGDQGSADQWQHIWTDAGSDPTETEVFPTRLEPGAEAQIMDSLRRLRAARDKPAVGQEGRDRLDAIMPKLMECAFAGDSPVVAIERVVPLLEAVLRRSAYLVLLDENPEALRLLLEICGSSRWMAAELARHPALLDDLLDGRGLFELPEKAELAAELKTRLDYCADPEAAQETLSAFKQSHSFRCAACELRGSLSLMNISDYLTFLAEVVLDAALDIAWQATAADLGEPADRRRSFVVLGYGKLGGLELGPDSDLDVVFVHDLEPQHARFLHRLVRRLMNLLTAHTYSGAMYDVDTRLRPDGNSGLMVSSLAGFEHYQMHDAWVWEHQALVRARPVAGDFELGARFMELRQRVLAQARDRDELASAVVGMRSRIEDSAEATADLKRTAGGIVDIEFVVQYLVLAWACEHPALCQFTDNVRILEGAARVGLLSEDQRSLLTDAYLALRAERHRSALDIVDDDRALDVLQQHQDGVRGVWDALLGSSA
jgi:glutamate-ammonia-ligase adenylyltransferase